MLVLARQPPGGCSLRGPTWLMASRVHVSSGGGSDSPLVGGGDEGSGETSVLGLFSGRPSSVTSARRSRPPACGENPGGESSMTMAAGDKGAKVTSAAAAAAVVVSVVAAGGGSEAGASPAS